MPRPKSKGKQVLKCVPLVYLPDEIIGSIATFAGPCALPQLFGIGNRILTQKLSSSTAIPFYTNINEYGNPSFFSLSLLEKLRGLKSTCLKDLYRYSISPWDSLSSLFLTLPNTIQEIEFWDCKSIHSFGDKAASSQFWDDCEFPSRFPYLQKLVLTYHERAWPKSYLDSFLQRLPPTLVHLGLGQVSDPGDHANATQFPSHLQTLSFDSSGLEGLSWLLKLPHLTRFVNSSASSWLLLPSDFEAIEMAETRHLSMKRLELAGLRNFKATAPVDVSKPLQDFFFEHFPNLEFLEASSLTWENFEAFPNLKSCIARTTKTILQSLPGSLTNLRLELMPREAVVILPQHLTALDLVYWQSDLSLLPRSLTELVVQDRVDLSQEGGNVAKLPPHLKILGVKFDFSKLDWQALPTSLQYFIGDDFPELYAKSPNEKLSLQKTGWTTLLKAAQKCDFEGLGAILRFQPRMEKIFRKREPWINILLAPNQPARKIPLACFDWLRNQGLCSKPARVGYLDYEFCWKVIWQDRPELVAWCSTNFTACSWKRHGPKILHDLADNVNCFGVMKNIHPVNLPIFPEVGATAISVAVTKQNPVVAYWLADKGYLIRLDRILPTVFNLSDYQKIARNPQKFEQLQLGSPKTILIELVIEFLGRNLLHYDVETTNEVSTRIVINDRPVTSESLTELIYQLWTPGGTSEGIFKILEFFEEIGFSLDFKKLSSKLVPELNERKNESQLLTALNWMSDRFSIKDMGLQKIEGSNSLSIAHYAAAHNMESILRSLVEWDFEFEEKGGPAMKTALEMIERKPLQTSIAKLYSRHKKQTYDGDWSE